MLISRSGLCWLLVLALTGTVYAAEAAPPRVAVVFDASNRGDGRQAMLTAELSRQGVVVVEREDLSRALKERALQALAANDGPNAAIENVDRYVNFRQVDAGTWLVEVVDAASGTLIGSSTVQTKTSLDTNALTAAAVQLLATEKSPLADSPVCVAVIEKGQDPRMFILAARLRDALRSGGSRVLDRALTQEAVFERADGERGWREKNPHGVFFGADYLIALHPEKDQCEVRVLRARDGQLMASRSFAFDGPEVIDAIQPWLLPSLGQSDEVPQPYLPTVEIEALAPFYRGLALFDAGHYAEATSEFTRAYLHNDKFRDAMEWEARCYDALNLAPLASAMRRNAEVSLVGNGSSGSAHSAPIEAVAFLGVGGSPDPLTSSISAVAASALAAHSGREIRLPEELDRLRREYDWLAGITQTSGARWEEAPSFFCRLALRGQLQFGEDGITVAWTLKDTLTGKTLARVDQALAPDPSLWSEQTQNVLTKLLSDDQPIVKKNEAPTAIETRPVAALENDLRAQRGLDANIALLKLAQADPAAPDLIVRGFEKGQSKRDGLDACLNFALRDWIIAQLPEGSSHRRWLELSRLTTFVGLLPGRRHASGVRLDVEAELEKFVHTQPADGPGLVAEYSLLYETQDVLPPGQLAQRCNHLLTGLQAVPELPRRDWVIAMTTALRDFALIADGHPDVRLPDAAIPNFPRRIRPKWEPNGTVTLEKYSNWMATEYEIVPLRPEEKIIEARAALAVNGRPGEHRKIPDQVLDELPHSIVLAAFLESSIHELNFWYGKPLAHPLDWEAERKSFLRTITYTAETLDFWLQRADATTKMDNLENIVWAFLTGLNERAYLGVFSDAQFETLRLSLSTRMKETNARLGRNGWQWKQAKFLSWEELTRAQSRELRKDRLTDVGHEVLDRGVLLEDLQTAERAALTTGEFDPVPWWNCLRRGDFDAAFTAPELAQFCLRFTPEVKKRFQSQAPTPAEMGFLYEQALFLFYGGKTVEAEEIFRLVLDAPSAKATDVLQANAAFRLAQILRWHGQKPESIEMARRGLTICGSTSWFVIGRLYEPKMQRKVDDRGVTGSLAAQLTRLLMELRFDPASAKLPPRVGVVTVSTPNADNSQLTVFYREPGDGDNDKPRQVLVLVPSMNHAVLEYLQPDSAWARFADAHGYVLVCPRFYSTERSPRAKHAFTYYLHAQIWSGPALVEALDKINERIPLRTDHLLFHGYGSGAGYVCGFARWRPDLVAAVSSHGGGTSLPWFQELPGLKPFEELKGIRFFVSGGEEDDFGESTQNRFATAKAMATVLRGAGVETEWRPFPGVGHFPTPEMEAASREFLSKP